jgi:hypothetical protein
VPAIRVGKGFDEHQQSTGPQHAFQRADASRLVGHLAEHRRKERDVEVPVGEWERAAGVPGVEADVLKPGAVEGAACLVEHLRLQVEQLEPALGQPAGDFHAEVPRPWADLEHPIRRVEIAPVDHGARPAEESSDRVVQEDGGPVWIGHVACPSGLTEHGVEPSGGHEPLVRI